MDKIREMNELRKLLHLNIYNRSNMELLIDYINNGNELLTIQDIDTTRNVVVLKIKKMNMKKMPLYRNNVMFYYDIINAGLSRFLQENIQQINSIDISNIINNFDCINLLYNINVIDDTSILLYL